MKPQPQIDMKQLQIIWFALLFSQVLFGIVLFTKINEHRDVGEANAMMIPVFASMSLVILGMAIFLPRLMINSQKKELEKRFGSSHPMQVELHELLQVFAGPIIVRMAMFESITLFGFALAFLHNKIELFFPFAAIGIAAHLMNFPTIEKVKAAFK